MPSQDLSPHASFLGDAAHLLLQTSPETSAFLMRRRNDLLVENDVPIPDGQRQHMCTCCGHIMIPGLGDEIKIETEKSSRLKTRTRRPKLSIPLSQDHARPKPAGILTVITCGKCSKQTRLKLEGPNRISRSKKINQQSSKGVRQDKQAVDQQQHAPPVPNEPAKSSSNASSKKRAKNRKAGLQAILDQKQSAAPASSFGLSLSDFMKK